MTLAWEYCYAAVRGQLWRRLNEMGSMQLIQVPRALSAA